MTQNEKNMYDFLAGKLESKGKSYEYQTPVSNPKLGEIITLGGVKMLCVERGNPHCFARWIDLV